MANEIIDVLDVAYCNLYFSGVKVMRFGLKLKRVARLVREKIKMNIHKSKHLINKKTTLFWRNEVSSVKKPFIILKRNLVRIEKNSIDIKWLRFKKTVEILRFIGKIVWGLVNWVLPVMAGFVLLFTVEYFMSLNFALSVEYAGLHMGYIENEAVFEQADKKMQERIVFSGEEVVNKLDTLPHFALTIIEDEQMLEVPQMTDKLIENSGNKFEPAYGFYVDNEFLGATTDKNSLLLALDKLKKEVDADKGNAVVEFVKPIEVTEQGLYPTSSIVQSDYLERVINSESQVEATYIVEKGDTPTGISSKLDIPYTVIKMLNPNIEERLMVGDEIITQGMQKFLTMKVVQTITYEEEISYKINQTTSTSYNIGYTKTTQEGEKGIKEITAKVTTIGGVEESREIVQTKIIKEAVDQEITVGGTKPISSIPPSSGSGTATGSFLWPTAGGSISYPIWGYPGHTGTDIIAPAGNPVYASQSGRVIKVQSLTYGYGKHIVIDHGNNVQTLYAHNSVLYVNVGDYVQQGQVIAGVGRTGRATANHVHFEIISNGRYLDARNYMN